MTNITKAAQQALEALESLVHNTPYDGRYSDAIIHLRAALAQQAQEPVARIDSLCVWERDGLWRAQVTMTKKLDQFTDLYAEPQAVKCLTCSGHGLIGGHMPDGSGHGEPCPDCNAPA